MSFRRSKLFGKRSLRSLPISLQYALNSFHLYAKYETNTRYFVSDTITAKDFSHLDAES